MTRRVSRWFLTAALVACAVGVFIPAEARQTPTEPTSPENVALYAAVGAELTHYEVVVGQATLIKRDSVTLPAAVQYAWPHPSGRHLYVAWSGEEGKDKDLHGVSALDVEPGSGALRLNGQAATLKYRPINVTVDRDGTHVLVVSNDPPGVTVYEIAPNGGIGAEVKQPANLDLGIYTHQVRVEPSNQTVVMVARGNYEGKHESGAIKIFNYKDGVLANRTSIAPESSVKFNPRHLDFDKSGRWVFVALEAQDQLQVYRMLGDGTLSNPPLFTKDTLTDPINVPVEHRQVTGTVHIHPNGQVLYAANRATATAEFQGKQIWAGGEDSIAVFQINQMTGEPTLIQNADTHGKIPRTFALDSSGRILVAANQKKRLVRNGDTLDVVPASLAVFRVRPDGKLDFVRAYDVDQSQHGDLYWMGIISVPR